MTGAVPTRPPLATSPSVARQCGETVPDRSLVVAPDGALAFAVVSVADGASLPAPQADTPAAVVDQRRCSYEPPVVAARAGSTLEILNSDPLIHNVRAMARSPLFNVAMPLEGMKLKKPLPAEPGLVALRCDVHPWMHASVKTFDHPFFAVTDAQGHYAIQGLPPGKHELVFWHERLPERRLTVEVSPGKTARQDAEWTASDIRGD